ncbi:bifunctional 3-oxoadipate enol-lactonase/4-carboxymuconolactone decarboxylase PcaDC [Sphingomonas prati]|uniref:3-oxoadipate enol-lactonase/4-carboxymuconolactone decarboxylase n=1 Tax=Sphingomonas prati TaxID=1843237 RepID=A0A7W9BV69_9SPHN|nr:3-oxoadipate enol-lactonase [Sphingomonas prati]MBB5730268.1 3-oxoadipate enol-lactonase/4-carboxymuconolactone decarboxylase [Sphingomonas prati]GGE92791.1 3-oxoadipate enol-lactonase [Sphingomonas prati]
MPFAMRDAVRIYWKLDGDDGAPPLVLLNSIGTDMALWDACLPALTRRFRVLRIDTRGHGASDAPEGDYDLPMLAADMVAAMDAAGIERAAVAGVSLGGMIAMQAALDHPARVAALALICTSATMDAGAWEQRIATVRRDGTAAIAELAMGRFLSPQFAAAHPAVAASLHRAIVAMADAGYAGAGAAIRDMDVIGRLPELTRPVLVVGGERDISTPFDGHGARIAAAIPGAEVAQLDCAHLAPIEAPAALAGVLVAFLAEDDAVAEAAETLFEAGLLNRRRVLGDAWVDTSLAGRTPFNTEFQAMITRIAWNEIWGRPGLDDATRRLLVVAITASLGRWEEFGLHVRAGLSRGGFTRDMLKEVLMQTAIYAGVPAANTGFAKAGRIIAELDAAQGEK